MLSLSIFAKVELMYVVSYKCPSVIRLPLSCFRLSFKLLTLGVNFFTDGVIYNCDDC